MDTIKQYAIRFFAVIFASFVVLLSVRAEPIAEGTKIKLPTAETNSARGPTMKNIPLIPRKVIFANPEKASASLSHDGKMIAFLAPVKNVLNVWVADIKHPASAKAVTTEKQRDIRSYVWSHDNTHILYGQDQMGNENFHLYGVDLQTGKIKDLTPFPGVQAQVIKMSRQFPNELLIGLNKRDPKWHDVYRLNIATGDLKLIEENNRFSSYVADEGLRLRIATKSMDDGGAEFYIKDKDGDWKQYERISLEDSLSTQFVGLNKEGTIAYKIDSQGRDKAALYACDLDSHEKKLLAKSDTADISSMLFHPTELIPQAWSYEYTKIKWTVLDPKIEKDFEYLQQAMPLDFDVSDRNLADDKWLVRYYSDTKPSRFYLYERDPQSGKPLNLTFLFTTSKTLEKQPFVHMQPIVIKSRDNLNLVCYLTLPPTINVDPDGIPEKPVPMVLYVHGGPWARDSWGLNKIHQWLANRGYAVLSVNYRGSVGLGKTFINAANMEWAHKMHDDLIDVVNWAIDKKIADSQKIAIMGGSYGGYATLVGLTFTPDVFSCGVSIVGPTNLITLIKTIPPYWKPDIALFKKRVGDIDTEKGRELLKERSPLTYVDRIKKPLLILQGEHDPRVKKAEADQIVHSMKEKSIPVTYVLFHDEGHGFVRQPNQMSSNAIIEQFLAENLGGRAESIKDDFAGANFSIPECDSFCDVLRTKSKHS